MLAHLKISWVKYLILFPVPHLCTDKSLRCTSEYSPKKMLHAGVSIIFRGEKLLRGQLNVEDGGGGKFSTYGVRVIYTLL